MSLPCFTLGDVEDRLKLVMEWFGNDMTEFMIFLSIYLHNHLRRHRPKLPKMLTYEAEQGKQGEEAGAEACKIVTDMSTKASKKLSRTVETDTLFQTLTSALEKGEGVDLLKLLMDSSDSKLSKDRLKDAQKIRRASTLGGISATFSSGEGRKLSAVEKNSIVIEEAKKLAEKEELEEEQFDESCVDDFAAGDEVIIGEGENCGLFGTLQHSSEGLFGLFGDIIKEDDEGNYGVDVHTENGEDEGYWIHPEAMQHKKYVAGDAVKVIDGINVGRTGTIQSDGKRLRMDEGAYGVDVKMDDGSIEGYWIHPKSMVPLNSESKEEEEEIDEFEEIDKFDFLPYIPHPGDAMDEGLAEALNTFEIDINIKRIVNATGKVVYRYGGKRHLVRYIHGVLLVRENGVWCELIPILRKLAGLPEVESDLFIKKRKKD